MRATAVLLLALSVVLPGPALARQVGQIVPQKDPSCPWGKVKAIEGLLPAGGLRFALCDLGIRKPVQAMLAVRKADRKLALKVYYDTFDKAPKKELKTDEKGLAVARFRSGANVGFDIVGPKDARYQFVVWVGEDLPLVSQPFVDMKTYLETHPEAARKARAPAPKPADVAVPKPEAPAETKASAPPTVPSEPSMSAAPAATAPASAPAQGTGGFSGTAVVLMSVIAILLIGVLVALAIVIVLISRKKQPPTALLLVALVLGAGSPLSGREAGAEAGADPYKPHPIATPEFWREVNREWQELGKKLREASEWMSQVDYSGVPKGGDALNKYAQGLPIVLGLLEEFGLLEKRENLVMPDYAPEDLPVLPIHRYPPGKDGDRVYSALEVIAEAHKKMEDNFVVYKQTMLTEQRLMMLMDAAADWSSLSKTIWAFEKANPDASLNKSKKHFLDTYDGAVENLSKSMREALLAVAECERKVHGEYDWYVRYGMPFYNYLMARYKRPGA